MKSLFNRIKISMHNRIVFSFMLMIIAGFNLQSVSANTNNIEEINYTSLPGNRLQINIRLSELAEKPLSFNIDNPARIASTSRIPAATCPRETRISALALHNR